MSTVVRKARQISESVWIIPHDWEHIEPTIGFVITDVGVVVIDGGNSPDHGRRVLKAIREITDRPIRYVIATHRHFDHSFGNQVYQAPIIAHALCRKKLESNVRTDWGPEKIHNWINSWLLPHIPTLKPEQFEGLKIVLPEITFAKNLQLELGDTLLKLIYLGGGHTHDSIGVHLPSEKVLFLADALYPNPEGTVHKLVQLFNRIAKLDVETLIASHETPFKRERFALRHEYFRTLLEAVTKLHRQRASKEAILSHLLDPKFQRLKVFSQNNHRQLVERLYQELTQH